MEKNIRKRIRMQILVLASSVLLVIVLIFAMTAAWFTNVAKTSSLTFETQSWGFDESKIQLSKTSVSITPGASGIIPLSIDNSGSSERVKITVTVSKAMMEPVKLQKRIYFYVDTPKKVAGETVSKVYLGACSPDHYSYTILPGQILTMNTLYYDDVPLKWEWVYDMLGYYFRGTVNAKAESTVIVDEYLRPIEYDYDQAVFDKVQDSDTYQQLLSVGEVSSDDLLVQISSEDGYAGTIAASNAVVLEQDGVKKLYYPVEIDGAGYGIWAYLCNYSEIEEGIAYDTQLAASGQVRTPEATIFLTAYTVPAQTESVNTEAALKTALTDADVDVVELSGDVATGSPIVFTEGTKVLDLNGYQLQYDGAEEEYHLFSVVSGATLTVTNGQIIGDTIATGTASRIKSKAFETVGGNLVLSEVKVTGFDSAVVVADYTAEVPGDSVVQIANCDLTAAQPTIFLQGNGAGTEALTKVIVRNSKLTSQYHNAINGQGNDERWGTELILADSEVNGYYGGIYQPQQKSVTVISNSRITGNTGIILKGGTMEIYDSTVYGTGAVYVSDAAIVQSGYTDTGDAIYVEAGYAWSASLFLRGKNVVRSDKAYAVEMIGEVGKGSGRILIYDGTYAGSKGDTGWDGVGTFEIYGGVYENDTVNAAITRYDK